MNSAINFRTLGYNLTILAYDYVLFAYMKNIQEHAGKMVQEHGENFKWDIFVAMMRHNLKDEYKRFLGKPSLQNKENEEWADFINRSIAYFFTEAYFYNKPIRLVSPDVFEQVITKGIYVNLTNAEKPDLVEGIDYIKYVKVGGR